MEQPTLPPEAQEQAKWYTRTTQQLRKFIRHIRIRSYMTGLGVMAILGLSYFVFAQDTTQTTTTTNEPWIVERKTITSSIKTSGSVTFANEQQLKFNVKGTVAKVNVKEGDKIKKGQVIAELEKTSAQADVTSAALALRASRLQAEQLRAEREADAMTAQNAVNSAKRSVEQAAADLEKTRSTELQSLASTAQDILIGSEKLLDSFYGVLTNDTAARPPADITTLEIDRHMYRDWGLKNNVEISFREGVNTATAMRQKYGTTLTTEQDADVILQALEEAENLAKILQNLSEQTYSLMQGASTDSITFTVDDLATLRSTVNTSRSTAAGYVEDAQTAKASLVALTTEESIPSTTLQTKEDTLATDQEAAAVKQMDLQNTLKNLDLQIQLKDNDASQKAASLAKLVRSLDDYKIVAPFDGTVRRVDYQVGDNLLADAAEDQYIILENRDYTVITILLDQVEIVRVKPGQRASITLDAIENRVFSGSIFEIDPTPVESSGVVSYNVSVRMPTPQDITILSGMTTSVEIETTRKENVLAVPNLAIRWVNNKPTVQTTDGQTVAVETGVSDGNYTEVTAGVQEGDSILAVNISSGTASSQSSATGPDSSMRLMRTLDGGGGGPPR